MAGGPISPGSRRKTFTVAKGAYGYPSVATGGGNTPRSIPTGKNKTPTSPPKNTTAPVYAGGSGGNKGGGGNNKGPKNYQGYSPAIPNVGMGPYGKQLRQLVNDLLNASRNVPGVSLSELRTSLVDPAEFADAATNARYASAIEAMKRARDEVGPQSELAQRDIGSWFDQTSATNKAGMDAERAAYEAERGSLDSLSQALMESIGGGANPAAGDLGEDALQASGALAAVQQAGLNFGNNMATNIQGQRAEALGREQNRSRELSADLAFDLAQMERERGDFRTAAEGEAQQQRFANLLGIGEYGMSRNKAGLDNRIALSNLLMGVSALPYELQGAALGVQGKAAEVGNVRATTDKIIEEIEMSGINPDSINLSNPSHVLELRNQLAAGIVGPNGNLALHPNKAMKALGDVLKSFGIGNDQGWTIAREVLRTVLRKSQANKMWKGWTVEKNPVKR